MTEWWTYGLSDFLMYSPRTWWRLVERANAAWWPWQLLGIAASLALPGLAALRRRGADRMVSLLLALAWARVGWDFHCQRHAEVSIAAPWHAVAFWLQAAVLLALASLRGRTPGAARALARHAGTGLMLLAALFPLAAPGPGWKHAEVFGFMPDPTALATLGWLLATGTLHLRERLAGCVLPVLALLASAAMRWAMAQA